MRSTNEQYAQVGLLDDIEEHLRLARTGRKDDTSEADVEYTLRAGLLQRTIEEGRELVRLFFVSSGFLGGGGKMKTDCVVLVSCLRLQGGGEGWPDHDICVVLEVI